MPPSPPRQQRLIDAWYAQTPRASVLQPLGWLYGLVMGLRRAAYASGLRRSHRIGRPVIVVGNLTVGGTGKTPLVAWLAGQLSATGLAVGIVSRGYGRTSQSVRTVGRDCDWHEVGDEPMLLWQRTGCHTVVARDRVAGARALVAAGADLVIADDGLQHLRLARDCEIVVVDGARGFGNGRLLPAGPLREPVSRLRAGARAVAPAAAHAGARAVALAPIVVVNGAAGHDSLTRGPGLLPPDALTMTLQGNQAIRLDGQGGPAALEQFRGQPVHAVAGIGNPQRFFRHLQAAGLQLIEHAFADHHAFSADELTFGDGRPVFMTEKDAVRCAHLVTAQLWYVPVTAQFTTAQSQELLARVGQALARSGQTSLAQEQR